MGVQNQRGDRERYELDPALAHVQRVVLEEDQKRISFLRSPRSILKFGENDALSTGVAELVWETGGLETLLNTNTIDRISSSDAGDVGVDIFLEGHTIAAGKLTRVTEIVTLNGQTPVSLTVPLARVERSFTRDQTEHVGTVYVYDTTATVTAGVPDTGIHIQQQPDDQQSQKAAIATASDEYFVVTGFQCSLGRNAASTARVTFQFMYWDNGFARRNIFELGTATDAGPFEMDFAAPIIIRPDSDFQIWAISSADNVNAKASFSGYYAKVYQ